MMMIIYVDPIWYLNALAALIIQIYVFFHNEQRTDKPMEMGDGWNRFLRKVPSSELDFYHFSIDTDMTFQDAA